MPRLLFPSVLLVRFSFCLLELEVLLKYSFLGFLVSGLILGLIHRQAVALPSCNSHLLSVLSPDTGLSLAPRRPPYLPPLPPLHLLNSVALLTSPPFLGGRSPSLSKECC